MIASVILLSAVVIALVVNMIEARHQIATLRQNVRNLARCVSALTALYEQHAATTQAILEDDSDGSDWRDDDEH